MNLEELKTKIQELANTNSFYHFQRIVESILQDGVRWTRLDAEVFAMIKDSSNLRTAISFIDDAGLADAALFRDNAHYYKKAEMAFIKHIQTRQVSEITAKGTQEANLNLDV